MAAARETVATVQAAGVPFIMEKTESPVCHVAIVTDPDGNPVGLHKRKAAPAVVA